MLNNDVLLAVSLIEFTESMLQKGKRVQLSRSMLEGIQRAAGQAVNKLANAGSEFSQINYNLLGVIDLINEALSDRSFDMTDEDTKAMIVKNIDNALSDIYLAAGKYYYEEHDFDYSFGLNELLERIINRCIEGGFYFGEA